MKRIAGMTSLLLAGSLLAGSAAAADRLATVAELSGYRDTGRYEEVERLCAGHADAWPDAVRCVEFGRTPEGRPMLALVVSRSGALTAAAARARDLPVLLVQGGIHAGEIDGKDAGFLALRELLAGEAEPGALSSLVLVFVPVFNVDGHERFGAWNRPNQNGPREMGWRTTAQNLNLNRDYAKADAPEMQAMLRLLGEWDPELYVDLHVTDGAQFEHEVAVLPEPLYLGDPALRPAARDLGGELRRRLAARGWSPLDFYPAFVDGDDPASGIAAGPPPPRFSTGYWALRNRFAMLVETHSWKDYPTRVRVTHDIVVDLAAIAAQRGSRWRTLQREADARAAELGGQEVPLDFEDGPASRTIDFRGYAYTREPSAVSGALATRYDPSRPQVWRIPLKDEVVTKRAVTAPRGGYVVPPAHAAWLADRLTVHGIRFERVERTSPEAAIEVFRATKVTLGTSSYEGHQRATLEGKWAPERGAVPAGALFVPIAQPKARLVVALLEPQAPDSYAAWGLFNTAFEAKEYMESYVAEEVARKMLEEDSETAAEFARRLATDAEFAKSPAARLDFFYRRHPSWDERRNLYPVYRLDSTP